MLSSICNLYLSAVNCTLVQPEPCVHVLTPLYSLPLAGSLGGAEKAAAMAAAAAEGMPAPLRPTKELYQEKSLNLADAWARVYLARGCGAVVHSRVGELCDLVD
jgi:hypothetical protein